MNFEFLWLRSDRVWVRLTEFCWVTVGFGLKTLCISDSKTFDVNNVVTGYGRNSQSKSEWLSMA